MPSIDYGLLFLEKSRILRDYLSDLPTDRLTREDEIALGRAIRQKKSVRHKKELCRRAVRLVFEVAVRYMNQGLPLIDLIGEGNIGVMVAAEKFDHRMGYRFSTYARWWIRHFILLALERHWAEGFTEARIIRQKHVLRQARRHHLHYHHAEPTPEQLAEMTDIPAEKVENYLKGRVGILPILNSKEHEQAWPGISEEILESALGKAAETKAQVEQVLGLVRKNKHLFTENELFVLDKHYSRGLNQTEIGDLLGMTRERARQIRSKLIKKLRLLCEEPPIT